MFLRIISTALVSSTNLMRRRQSDNSLLVITLKRSTPNLVPWGTPPFSGNQSDKGCEVDDKPHGMLVEHEKNL